MNLPASMYKKSANVIAAVVGFLLMFGSTNVSPFELVAGTVIVLTLAVILFGRSLTVIFQFPQNLALYSFLTLVVMQTFYVQDPNMLYMLVTIYLIAFYLSVQYWYASFPSILQYAMYGYVGAAVCSAVLGGAGYIGKLFAVPGLQDLFFWGAVRISVFYSDPVVYGAFLIPALLFFSYKTSFSYTFTRYTGYGLITLLLFANLILTGSRGAWLNFLVAGALFFLLYKPFYQKNVIAHASLLASTALMLAVMLIYVIPLNDRTYYAATIEHRYLSSDGPRLEHLRTVPRLMLNRPLHEIVLGSGSGQYERKSVNGFSAHNVYLRTLYEQGVLGILLLVTFLGYVIWRISRLRNTEPLIASLLLAIIGGMLAQGLFVDVIHWRHFWFVLAFIL